MKIEATNDIGACRRLRRAVFVEEQGISEAEELDDLDAAALHLLAWDGAEPVGTARILQTGTRGRIGRVCVLSQARGRGLGAKLILAGIDLLRQRPGVEIVELGAQTHALTFYEKLGFQAEGEPYDDAGIPHMHMTRKL